MLLLLTQMTTSVTFRNLHLPFTEGNLKLLNLSSDHFGVYGVSLLLGMCEIIRDRKVSRLFM